MDQNPENKYAGIILAAGLSSRMNSWKPELIIGSIPLVVHAVKSLLPFCSRIIVVGGFQYNRLEKIITDHTTMLFSGKDQIVVAENKDYEKGMFSSVQKAVSFISNDYAGVFLLPGDMPFVRSSTAEMLIKEYESGEAEVVIPAVRIAGEDKLRKGHPVIFSMGVCSA
ncbi:MAG: nucleotidyltransferase family protein, partial [Syntrophothermus sp.]